MLVITQYIGIVFIFNNQIIIINDIDVFKEVYEDIFDYQFLIQDTYIEILVEKADGEQWILEIDKDFDTFTHIIQEREERFPDEEDRHAFR